ncbi:MAG: V-type ATP synthase subunit D [Verrucomicrobia bacterium]|nr:V-type ATP synthase subunit D [Verrucomicrobiota bacterium]MBS0645614.1 V-type ATP synthase subunit D [Verrucomicrobiota bacterium]
MSEIKLTKNALRLEQIKLTQLQRYLPTLQLKKAMLQTEVNEVRLEIQRLEESFDEARLQASSIAVLFSQHIGIDFLQLAKVERVEKRMENIAGVEIPIFEKVHFSNFDYPLFSTPAWLDGAIAVMQELVNARARVLVAEEKKAALEKELREVSIRVNLFEKNLIPKAMRNIKKIKVFLGDQALAAVGQAKVAKTKIEQRKEAKRAH